MYKIYFDTFSYTVIKKDLKANIIDKLSHFGGTAGLLTGFSFLTAFEILLFLFTFLCDLILFFKKPAQTSTILEVKESQPNQEEMKIEKLKDQLFQKFEVIEKELLCYRKELSGTRYKMEKFVTERLMDIERRLYDLEK